MEFVESYMKFSFEDDSLFRIEEDELVTSREGVKACECVVSLGSNAALIEAKSSSPKPQSGEKYQAFMQEIEEKISSSLALFRRIRNGEFGEKALKRLPPKLRDHPVGGGKYAVYLIVHGNEIEWMPGLQDALREFLRSVIEEWGISDSNVKALNQEMALALHLIVGYVPLEKRKGIEAATRNPEKRRDAARKWLEEQGRNTEKIE